MAASNILKSGVSSFTGNIEKAILEITDDRDLAEPGKIKTQQVKKRGTTDLEAGSVSEKITQAVAGIAEKAKNSKGLQNAAETLKKAVPEKTKGKKRFEVRFNPSQITFHAVSGSKLEKFNATAGEKTGHQDQKMDYRIQMNIPLVFDSYDRTEAFMLEKFSDVTSAARMTAGGVVSALNEYIHSVQHKVEGLTGALKNQYTRMIALYWGTMKYEGALTNVNAEYTMFSPDGTPIRAKVTISIHLVDQQLSDNYMGIWQDSFHRVFEGDKASKVGNTMSTVGSVFNIKM